MRRLFNSRVVFDIMISRKFCAKFVFSLVLSIIELVHSRNMYIICGGRLDHQVRSKSLSNIKSTDVYTNRFILFIKCYPANHLHVDRQHMAKMLFPSPESKSNKAPIPLERSDVQNSDYQNPPWPNQRFPISQPSVLSRIHREEMRLNWLPFHPSQGFWTRGSTSSPPPKRAKKKNLI